MTTLGCGGAWAKTRCRDTAARPVKAGCRHEHVLTIALCEQCRGRLAEGWFCCRACLNEADHLCPLDVRVFETGGPS